MILVRIKFMGIIYHHTDVNGLIGIIQNNNLWATNIHYLNDYNEFKNGIEALNLICEKHINSKIKEEYANIEEPYKLFLSVMNESLKVNLEKRNHYIVSFTKSRDNLRQWMSYGVTNASYAIGFDDENLKSIQLGENTTASEDFTYCLNDVSYSMSKFENLLSAESVVKNLHNNRFKTNKYAIELVNELLFGLCSLKDLTFADENEVRMVLQDRKIGAIHKKIQYRNQLGVITPYIKVPIPLDAIREIIIGPNIHKELATKGLESLLISHGIKCKIDHTECSLRQF